MRGVERLRLVIDGVDQKRAYADISRHLQGPQQSVLQQASADSSPLIIEVDGKPAENHHRHQPRQPLPDLAGHALPGNASSGERVIAGDPRPILDRIGPGRAPFASCRLVAKSIVEESVAAVERSGIVIGAERLRR